MSGKTKASEILGIPNHRVEELGKMMYGILPKDATVLAPADILLKVIKHCYTKEEAAWCSYIITLEILRNGTIL